MSTVLVILTLVCGFLLWGIYLAAIVLFLVTGYSFGRIVAKLMGWGNASGEEFREQRRRFAFCAATYAALLIVFCMLMFVIHLTGTMEGPG